MTKDNQGNQKDNTGGKCSPSPSTAPLILRSRPTGLPSDSHLRELKQLCSMDFKNGDCCWNGGLSSNEWNLAQRGYYIESWLCSQVWSTREQKESKRREKVFKYKIAKVMYNKPLEKGTTCESVCSNILFVQIVGSNWIVMLGSALRCPVARGACWASTASSYRHGVNGRRL